MVYPGSKNRLAIYFVPLLQRIIEKYNITTYIEPFVGAVQISLIKSNAKIKLLTINLKHLLLYLTKD